MAGKVVAPPSNDDWQELMGSELMMKVIGSIPQKSYGDVNNNEDKKSAKIEPQEAVLINFEGRVAADRTVRDGPLFQEANGWLIVVGSSSVLPALEMVRKFPGLFFSSCSLCSRHSCYSCCTIDREYALWKLVKQR